MNKIFKKNRKELIEIAMYLLLLVIGVVIMSFPAFGLIYPIYYISLLYFFFTFISFITYFLIRDGNDYELLFLTLTNVIVSSFFFIMRDSKPELILGIGIVIFLIGFIITRTNSLVNLKEKDELLFLEKLITTILLFITSVLTIYNLFNGISVQTYMIGYYFIMIGLIFIFDPLFRIVIKGKKIKKLLKK